MSTTIDQKVVEMKFDNKQFEQGVSQSINSTEKLKSSLDFSNTANSAKQNLNVTVQGFSALATITDQVLRNITNAAWGQFTNILNNLGVGLNNIASGWAKYNTLTKSTQVIMSATRDQWEDQGAQMEYVTSQVEKLNWYTDETSWNLTDMTSNIGKFVSAGVDIDTATSAMIGIGSWAGQSGAGVEQMSRAMYNLSQAMAMGTVRVQDWMSIENANMATKEFKQTVIDTALEVGTLHKTSRGMIYALSKGGKKIEVTAENFRSTLSEGWFTGEVLTTSLKRYGDFANELYKTVENTGLTATETLEIIDDYKEALKNGLDQSDTEATDKWLENIASERNISNIKDFKEGMYTLTSEYNELGLAAFKASQECKTFEDVQLALADAMSTAFMGMFNTIAGDYLQAKELWSQVAEELYEVFIDDLNEYRRALEAWARMGGRENLLNALWNFWYNIKDIINAVKEGFAEVFPDKTAKKLLYFTQDLLKFSENLRFLELPYYSDFNNIKDAVASLARIVEIFWNNIKSIAKQIKKAWERIFPKDPHAKTFTETLRDAAAYLESLAQKFKITEDQADKLERTFAGLFAILDILKMLIIAILEPFFDLDNETEGLADGVLNVTASIGDWIVSVRDWLKENDTFRKGVSAVVNFIRSIPGKLDKVCRDLFDMGLDEVWENIKNAVSTAWEAIKNFFINLPDYAEQASQSLFGMSLDELFDKIKEAASNAWDAIKNFFAGFRKENPAEEENTFAESTENLSNVLSTVREELDKSQSAFEKVKPYLDEFKQMLSETFDFSDFTAKDGKDLLISGGVFGVLIAVAGAIVKIITNLGKISEDSDKILKSIKGFFDGLTGVTAAVKKRIQADVFKTLATAILEIAVAMLIMAMINPDRLNMAAGIVILVISEMGLIFKMLSDTKADPKAINSLKKAMNSMMIIIAEIVGGMYLLAQMDMNSVLAAGSMISLILIIILAFFLNLDKIKFGSILEDPEKRVANITAMMKAISVIIGAIGASIAIMAAVGDWSSILAAGAMIAVLLAEIGLLLMNLDKIKITPDKVAEIGALMKSIGAALILMGVALAIASSGGDWESIAAGGIVLALMLVAIAGAMRLMPTDKKIKGVGKSLIAVSAAMILMGVALAVVAKLPIKGLVVGVLALAIMMAAVAKVLEFMGSKGDDMTKAAIALTIASASLILMAVALGMLAEVAASGHAVEALIMMGVALAALVAAAYLCQNPAMVAALYAIGAAVALIGVGALAAGTGMYMFASAISMLANLGPEGIEGLSNNLIALFTTIPNLASSIGESILNIIDVFLANRDRVLNGIVTLIDILIDAIRTELPKILNLVGETITNIINLLIALTPQFGELLRVIFYETNDLIWELAPEMIATLIMLTRLAFEALITLFWEQTPQIISALIMFTFEVLRGLAAITPQITKTAIDILIDTLRQINENIFEVASLLTQIGLNLIFGIMDGFIAEIPTFIDISIKAIIQFIDGLAQAIDDNIDDIIEAGQHLADSLINAFKKVLGINSPSTVFEGFGGNIIQGLLDGLNKMWESLKKGITSIANDTISTFKGILGINSPSKVFHEIGEYVDEGFANGLNDYANKVTNASENVGNTAITTVSDAISTISDALNSDMDTTPTIRPVLDLTNVANGVNAIDGMLNSNRTMELAADSNTNMNNRVSEQSRMTSAFNDLKLALSGMSAENGSVTQNNTFNITGDNPREIAEEVSRIIQHQVDRRGAVWAQ